MPADKPVDLMTGPSTQYRYLATQASTDGRLGLYFIRHDSYFLPSER